MTLHNAPSLRAVCLSEARFPVQEADAGRGARPAGVARVTLRMHVLQSLTPRRAQATSVRPLPGASSAVCARSFRSDMVRPCCRTDVASASLSADDATCATASMIEKAPILDALYLSSCRIFFAGFTSQRHALSCASATHLAPTRL